MSTILATWILGIVVSSFMSLVSYSTSDTRYSWFDVAAVIFWPVTIVLFIIFVIRTK